MHKKTLVSRGVTLALLMSSGGLMAQQAEQSDALEEITVTAQFRSQNLQETPLAITAVTGDMLEARSQTSIYEVAAQAPSVFLAPQAQANGSGLIAYIRGVGQTDFNYALEPGVGLYVDDVYYPTLTGSLLDLLDLDRVEVLRGPQGTLAGRNSIGGAIKLFSRVPTGSGGNVSVTYGSYDRTEFRGSGDFTLAEDKLFLRIAGVSKNRDGYVDRMDYGCTHPGSGVPTLRLSDGCRLGTLGGISYTAARASLRWVASDKVELTVIGDVTNDNSDAGADVLRRAVQTSPSTDPRYVWIDDGNPNTVPTIPYDCRFVPYGANSCDPNAPNDPYLSYATFVDATAPTNQRPFKPVVVPPVQTLNQYGFSANLDINFSETTSLKSITSWRKYTSDWAQDVDGSPAASQQLLQTLSHWAWTEELRLNSSIGEAFDYTVGAFYMDQDGTLKARVDLNYAGIDFIHGPDPTPSTSQALFAQGTWHATDKLDVTAGVRYTEDEKDYTYHRHNPDGTLPVPPTGFPFAPTQPPNAVLAGLDSTSAHFESDQFDWRFVVDYQWTDDIMTYIQASTGYKGGGINPRPFFVSQELSFDPETLTTYEVGFKSTFMENRIRLNMAAFFNKYEDIILRLNQCPQSPPGQQTPCQLPANVGKADVKGVELEANMLLGAGFSADVALSYLDFKYTETNFAQTNIPTSYITPFTPEEKGSLGLQWHDDFDNGHALTIRADVNYQSQVYGDAFNNPYNRIPAYGVTNVRMTWAGPDAKWQASIEALNVTDKLYYLATNDYSASAGSSSYSPGLPRTYALTVKRSFE
ncbi:MAG TPA: TonB-dependent receptor [Steroidobacteraceae bacterium]|nr:TonB-dependent receptor [Steroidobacteraceae bacterium]